jgi:hypothetical protein
LYWLMTLGQRSLHEEHGSWRLESLKEGSRDFRETFGDI